MPTLQQLFQNTDQFLSSYLASLAQRDPGQLNSVDENGDTLLHLVCRARRPMVVKTLATLHRGGYEVGFATANRKGYFPLLISAALGDGPSFSAMLDAQAGVSVENHLTQAPLRWYMEEPRFEVIEELLIIRPPKSTAQALDECLRGLDDLRQKHSYLLSSQRCPSPTTFLPAFKSMTREISPVRNVAREEEGCIDRWLRGCKNIFGC